MAMSTRRTRDQRGIALPSPVVLLSIVAVALAIVAFVVTGNGGDGEKEITPASAPQTSASPSATASTPSAQTTPKKRKHKPQVDRAKVNVEVFNNTNIRGLAGDVAAKASTIGWNVVGADNWMGTVPETTVYYPVKLKAAAKKLALDLGIKRTHVAESDSMKGDRLTVVLTGALA